MSQYVMRGVDSVTSAVYTWTADAAPDFAGVNYPGPNAATQVLAIATRDSSDATGPAGPAGPEGPEGPEGPAGAPGVPTAPVDPDENGCVPFGKDGDLDYDSKLFYTPDGALELRGTNAQYFIVLDSQTFSQIGLFMGYSEPATVGEPVKRSPALSWDSQAWDTDGAFAAGFAAYAQLIPVSGAVPYARLCFSFDEAGEDNDVQMSAAGIYLKGTAKLFGGAAEAVSGGTEIARVEDARVKIAGGTVTALTEGAAVTGTATIHPSQGCQRVVSNDSILDTTITLGTTGAKAGMLMRLICANSLVGNIVITNGGVGGGNIGPDSGGKLAAEFKQEAWFRYNGTDWVLRDCALIQ